MIKFICDRCKKEFLPQKEFLEGSIAKTIPLLFTPQKGQPMMANQKKTQIVHLCPDCLKIFEEEFLNPKQI